MGVRFIEKARDKNFIHHWPTLFFWIRKANGSKHMSVINLTSFRYLFCQKGFWSITFYYPCASGDDACYCHKYLDFYNSWVRCFDVDRQKSCSIFFKDGGITCQEKVLWEYVCLLHLVGIHFRKYALTY